MYIFNKSKYYQIFNERILEKFNNKIESGDVLDRRGNIFSSTVTDANIFGHGPDYFSQTYGLGAHNSFISILGQYGYLASALFILFWVYVIYIAFKHFYSSHSNYSILPILLVLFFLMTSMTEIMLMKASMLFAFIAIGTVSSMNIERYAKNTKQIPKLKCLISKNEV